MLAPNAARSPRLDGVAVFSKPSGLRAAVAVDENWPCEAVDAVVLDDIGQLDAAPDRMSELAEPIEAESAGAGAPR